MVLDDLDWKLMNDYESVIHAISTGQPLVLDGGSGYADELKGLARSIAHGGAAEPAPDPSFVGRLFSSLRPSRRDARPALTSPEPEVSHG